MNNEIVSLLFSLKGRVPRKTYWLYMLAAVVAALVPFYPFVEMGSETQEIYINVVSLVFFWPGIAIQVKRWHDIDSSGVWFFVIFVPFIGGLWALIANGFMRGTTGDNLYGPDPYANETPK
jgi:uncharacterized membrane protein YhaH (DUF805 family)